MRRRYGLAVALILLALVVVAAAVWAALPRLIQDQAEARLRALGLAPVRVPITAVSVHRAVATDVWLTPSLHVDRVVATYDPLRLTLDEVTVEGLALALDLRDGRVSANGLERLLEGGDGGPGSGPGLALPMERLVLRGLTVHVATAEGTLLVGGDVTARTTPEGLSLDASLMAESGGLAASLSAEGTLHLPLPGGFTGHASLHLSARDGDLPGLAYGVDGVARARLEGAGRTVTLRVAPDTHLAAQALAPPLAARVPDGVRQALPLPWSLRVGAEETAATATLTAPSDDAATTIAASGTAMLEGAQGRLRISGQGAVEIEDAHRVRAMRAERLAVEATGLTVDATTWSLFATVEDLRGIPLLAEAARSRLVLEAEGLDLGRVTAPRAALSLSGPLTWGGFAVLFGIQDGLLDVAGPLRVGGLRLPRGAQWRLEPAGQMPGLEVALAADGAVTLVPRLRVAAPQAVVEAGGRRLEARFTHGTLTGVVPLPASPALRLEARLEGGEVRDGMATLDDVSGRFALTPGGLEASASATVEHLPGETAPLPRPARAVRPFRLSVDARGGRDVRALDISARLEDAAGRLVGRLAGSHDLATGRGQARVTVPQRAYAGDGVTPEDYYTPLGAGGTRITGTIGAEGMVRWTADSLRPDLDVLLKDVVISHGFLTLDRVNGVLDLTAFWPPRTPPGQTLAVAAIRAGLPLTDAVAEFRLDGQGAVALDRLTLHLADGTLEAGAARIPLDASSGRLSLDVQGMDLSRLLELIDLPGLSASGTLQGTLPLRLDHGNVIVENGRLAASGPGRSRYLPDDPPDALSAGGQSTDLLLKALADFRYKALTLTLNGSAAGDMEVALNLEGANPDLYDGYPVDFTLTVSGALSQIIGDALRGYQVPDRIRERIQGFTTGR